MGAEAARGAAAGATRTTTRRTQGARTASRRRRPDREGATTSPTAAGRSDRSTCAGRSRELAAAHRSARAPSPLLAPRSRAVEGGARRGRARYAGRLLSRPPACPPWRRPSRAPPPPLPPPSPSPATPTGAPGFSFAGCRPACGAVRRTFATATTSRALHRPSTRSRRLNLREYGGTSAFQTPVVTVTGLHSSSLKSFKISFQRRKVRGRGQGGGKEPQIVKQEGLVSFCWTGPAGRGGGRRIGGRGKGGAAEGGRPRPAKGRGGLARPSRGLGIASGPSPASSDRTGATVGVGLTDTVVVTVVEDVSPTTE